jgi:transcriptional regulator with XRE-family HTH domain
MKKSNTKLCDRIRDLCLESGWSHSGLSRKAGLGKGAVADILAEPGRSPRPLTIAKLASTLGVDPEYLVGETDVRAEPIDLEANRPGKLGAEIQKVIRSIVALNNDHASYFTLPDPVPALGLAEGALAVVTWGNGLLSGDLVVARVNGRAQVCYVVGRTLVSLSGTGQINHYARDDSVEILGHLEFAGTVDLGKV